MSESKPVEELASIIRSVGAGEYGIAHAILAAGYTRLDPYDDHCPTCDAPVPWHAEDCAVPMRRHGERPHSRVSATSPGGRYGISRVERTIMALLKAVGWLAFIAWCLMFAGALFLWIRG